MRRHSQHVPLCPACYRQQGNSQGLRFSSDASDGLAGFSAPYCLRRVQDSVSIID